MTLQSTVLNIYQVLASRIKKEKKKVLSVNEVLEAKMLTIVAAYHFLCFDASSISSLEDI